MSGGTRVSSPQFVGRQEHVAGLEALLDRARSGQACAALLTGDAGMGKTRLVEEVSGRAGGVGATVLHGGCVDIGRDALPYAPYVEMLHMLVRNQGPAGVLELAGSTAEELSRLAPALQVGAGLGDASRASASRLYQAFTALIEGLARRSPLVLVVEDVHWADHATKDLLLLLTRNVRGRILTMITARSDEAPTGVDVRRLTLELQRAGAVHVRLEPLSRDEQARQISGIVGVPPPTSLVDEVYSRADGNPLFAEELLALGSPRELPATVRDLFLARVEALPADTQQVLRAAAAVGRDVGHGLLAAVIDMAGTQLDDALRPAVDAHVLVARPDGGGSYRFRHALLQEAIARTLLPGEATRLHRRIAEALDGEAGSAGSGATAARIAHHWHAAGDAPRALVASMAAAREAENALAFNEALAHYERVIALLDEVDGGDELLGVARYRMFWLAAESAHLAAHPQRAAELVGAAIDTVDPNEPLHRAYLHERRGRYLWMAAEGEAAMAAYERAVELVPPGRTCWRAAILSGYAQILMLAGRNEESLGFCHEAIDIASQVDDARSTEGHARNNLGVNLATLGDLEAGVEQLRLARRIAEEEFDDVDDIARAIVNLHSVLLDAGRVAEAAEVALDGIEVAEKLGLGRRKGVWCRCDAADALHSLGRLDEADTIVEAAFSLSPQGIDWVRAHFMRGRIRLTRGELGDARRDLQECRAAGDRVIDGQHNGPLFAALVELETWAGNPAVALEVAAEGAARLLPEEEAAFCLPLHAAAARAAADAGDAEAADHYLALAGTAVQRDRGSKPGPAAHLLMVRAEGRRARGEAAVKLWAAAAQRWRDQENPYQAAYCAWRQTESCLSQDRRAEAAEAARAALAAAGDVGARLLVAEIDQLARRGRLRLGRRSSSHVARPFHLTSREGDVLALVAEGQTDRQIGEQLFISHRTVERHVSNILAKLDAATRAEAVAIVHKQGLTADLR